MGACTPPQHKEGLSSAGGRGASQGHCSAASLGDSWPGWRREEMADEGKLMTLLSAHHSPSHWISTQPLDRLSHLILQREPKAEWLKATQAGSQPESPAPSLLLGPAGHSLHPQATRSPGGPRRAGAPSTPAGGSPGSSCHLREEVPPHCT